MSLTNLPHRGPQPMSSLERSWRMLRLGFGFMRNFAALPDTPNYRLFAERKRCYFLARFTRPV